MPDGQLDKEIRDVRARCPQSSCISCAGTRTPAVAPRQYAKVYVRHGIPFTALVLFEAKPLNVQRSTAELNCTMVQTNRTFEAILP